MVITRCPRCGHHINIPPHETVGYCPMCDKEVPSIKKRKAINAGISKYISNVTGFRHKGFGLEERP